MSGFAFTVVVICAVLSPLLAYLAVSARRSDFVDPGSVDANAAASKLGIGWVFGHVFLCLVVIRLHFHYSLGKGFGGDTVTDQMLYAILVASTVATFVGASGSTRPPTKPRDRFHPMD